MARGSTRGSNPRSEPDGKENAIVVKRGMIQRIECDNFKSYKGHQVIGPFKQFTSIIGPNGSGKSNLMDAISFVLGVQSAQLRGTQLKDLVYAFDVADREKKRAAYVRLVYETEEGEEIVFSRHITPAGTGEYRIANKVVTAEAYNDRLKDFGILVKARNFLVFQGDIESVASKSPKDLTSLVETVSGSEELKKEYELARVAKKDAEDAQQVAFTKRKGLQTQRRQMKEQKEEAEKHLRMTKELDDAKAERALFKLFHIDFDAKRHEDDIAEASGALKEHDARVEACAKDVEEKRSLKATHAKKQLMLERKIAKHKADGDKKNPHAVRVKEETSRTKKRLELATKQLQRHAQDAAESKADVERLTRDLENVNAAEKAFEKDFAERQKKKNKDGGDLELGAKQMDEYNRRKEEAGAKTFKLRQERDGLAAAAAAEELTRARHASKVDELAARLAVLDEQLESERARDAALRDGEASTTAELEDGREREKAITDEKRKSRAKQENLAGKVEELSGKLREAKADRKESERETRAAEAVTSLRRMLPGVHGRVTDLIKVSQKKFNLAVITVLGKDADAVVVDDAATAKECVRYLKEQRIAPMTFLPVNQLKVFEPDERLRHLGGTSKLCVDVVSFDESVKRAMIYAMGGDTLVCDTHEEAKRHSFGAGDRRLKVVSLDGTMIKKSGEMTGGNSGSLEAKASRFDAEEIEQLRADRQAAEESLAKIKPVAALIAEEQESAARLARLEKDLQYAAVDRKMCAEKIEKLTKDAANIKRELDATSPELKAAEKACEKAAAAVEAVEAKIHAAEDAVYAEFSASVGVANIREYEENNLAMLQLGAEERARFTTQRAKLTEQLNYERSRDTEGPRARAAADIERFEKDLERLLAEAEKAKAEAEERRETLEAWEREAAEAKADAEAVEQEVKDVRQRLGVLSQEGAKLQRLVGNKRSVVDALRESRADIIAAARMERIKLPRAEDDEGGDDDDDVLALPAPVKKLTSGMDDDDDDDDGEVDADAMEADEEERRKSAAGFREAAFKTKLDYDGLAPRLKQAPRPSDRERIDDELRANVEKKLTQLERLEPNMKAIDQYEGIKEKERAQTEELEECRKKTKAAHDAFERVKSERASTFMAAYKHISDAIDKVYKELTMSPSHPLGGTAYLALESLEEPYNAGLKFTAMPPTKRFREMEALSGGEKTMAALALLFAIHSYKSSPFFVLDEIDASLDKTNVEKMARFIRNRSHGLGGGADGAPCQSIVISLKDYFFDKADSLVGVTRDVHDACSRVLTFDLEPYGEPEE